MRRALLCICVLGCGSDPAASTKEAPAPAPAVVAADAAKQISVPAGPLRLREATLGAAVLLSAHLWQLDIVALGDPERRATFAIARREDVGRELAARYGGEAAEKDGVLVLAPAGRATAALAAAGTGRAMDLTVAAAAGDDRARLAAHLAGARPVTVGGRFAVAVTAMPAGRLLAMIHAMCPAGACPPVERVPLAPSPLLDPRHRLRADDIEMVRLAGIAVEDSRAFAALAGEDAVEVVEPGDPVGAPDTRCGNIPAMGSWAALDRLRAAERAVDREIESLLAEKPVTAAQHVDVRKRLAELEMRRAAAAEKRAREEQRRAPPPWCRHLDAGDSLVWRVAAIDTDGVTLEPVHLHDGDVALAGPAFPAVPPRRLRISD